MKCASVYARSGAYFLHPDGTTTDGLRIAMSPCVRLPAGCSDVELGEAVIAALGASRTGLRHPWHDEWKLIPQPLLRAARVRSWRAFAREASQVSLTLEADALTVTPWKRDGDGFVDDPGRPEEQVGSSAVDIGAALRRFLGPIGS